MESKTQIEKLIQNLLQSARSRNTTQGVTNYQHTLNTLSTLGTESEHLKIELGNLNQTLAGIEAHGYFTREELLWIEELRKIELLL